MEKKTKASEFLIPQYIEKAFEFIEGVNAE